MALIDTLYDILSGVGGTLFGVALTTTINYRRNKRITTLLADTQSRVESLASENNRLMAVVREKENHILALENQILKSAGQRISKKRGK